MAVHLACRPVGLCAGHIRQLTSSCGSKGISRVPSTAFAYAAYVAVMAALLVSLTPGTAKIHGPGSGLADVVDGPVVTGQAAVLTITVDGPADSVAVLCATTTDRAPFESLHVSPEQVLDAFDRWCSPGQPVTGV